MAVIGYARVSTSEQSTGAQQHQIEQVYKIDRWFIDDAVSGTVAAMQRPSFKACLEYLREGDQLIVAAIDRLGRSTLDVLNTVELLQEKGVHVTSQREGFDVGTPIGKAMLTMLAAVAELERSNIKSRQAQGIAKAKEQGKHLGRPRDIEKEAKIIELLKASESKTAIAKKIGVGRSTVYRLAERIGL
ncbi:recombinase family protein [Oceanisphaera sp. IT1-181]|uniref:recombinase family protein n=1 Tax=Oceanisphaera sp. IT1-181 TaxID=3081199 RepID=UPI0029C9E9A5|nr:recombinase family protein [Oceanisphaera sp. IT1-181]